MLKYRSTIIINLDEVNKDLHTLGAEEMACASTIDSMHQ
jgi:hypothetical protein